MRSEQLFVADELESRAWEIITQVEELGGAVAAIEAGYPQRRIEDSAYAAARRQESGEDVVVGVNRYVEENGADIPIMEIDPSLAAGQLGRLAAVKAARDGEAVARALAEVRETAAGTGNLLWPMKTALAAEATIGEICDELRSVFGTHGSM